MNHATPAAGSYQCAYADFTLSGTVSDGDYVGLAYLAESVHVHGGRVGTRFDGRDRRRWRLRFNGSDPLLQAVQTTAATIRVYYTGGGPISTSTAGANGNVFSDVYVRDGNRRRGIRPSKTFANGTSPTAVECDARFQHAAGLGIEHGDFSGTLIVPTYNIRKMRWTYAADLQAGAFDAQ